MVRKCKKLSESAPNKREFDGNKFILGLRSLHLLGRAYKGRIWKRNTVVKLGKEPKYENNKEPRYVKTSSGSGVWR